MADVVTGFNPNKIKLGTMLRAERAWGVKFTNIVRKVELNKGEMSFEDFDLAEMMTFVFVMAEMSGKPMSREAVEDLDVEELQAITAQFGSPVESRLDPHEPNS